jgi:hypothetical protein
MTEWQYGLINSKLKIIWEKAVVSCYTPNSYIHMAKSLEIRWNFYYLITDLAIICISRTVYIAWFQ